MLTVDLRTLAHEVRAILADPAATLAPTGDAALDSALADLRAHCQARRPLPASHVLGYWHPAPAATPARADGR